MSIVYPLEMPTLPSFSSVTMRAITNHGSQRSVFSLETYTQANDGMVWLASVNLPMMDRASAEPWIAFLLKLNGPVGTFWFNVPTMKTPRGTPSGSPLVEVIVDGDQYTHELQTKGWTPSAANVLKAGDMIGIGSRLYKVLTDVSADGSGKAVIDIWPKQSQDIANNAVITTTNAKGLFRLVENDYDVFQINADGNISLSFNAVDVNDAEQDLTGGG